MDPNQNSTPADNSSAQTTVITPDQPKPSEVIQPSSNMVGNEAPKQSYATSPTPLVPSLDEKSNSGLSPTTPKPTEPVQPAMSNPLTPALGSMDSTASQTDPQRLATPPVQSDTKKRKPKTKIMIIAVAAVVALLGASAGAYYGVVVPNKPENKLYSAIMDMPKQTQVTTTGKIDFEDKSDYSNDKIMLEYKMQTNTETNQFALSGSLGAEGYTFDYDMRYIEEAAYLKVGGLDNVGKAMMTSGATSKENRAMVESLVSSVNDKWFVLNSDTTKELTKDDCDTLPSLKLSEDDLNILQKAYRENPLFTIKSQAEADVSGVKTTKYELDPAGNDTAKRFAKEAESMSIIQTLNKCLGLASDGKDEKAVDTLADNSNKAQLFVYITSDKKMKKLEIIQDDDKSKLTFTAEFAYGDVKIDKPEGATPVEELIGNFLGGSLSSNLGIEGTEGMEVAPRLFNVMNRL